MLKIVKINKINAEILSKLYEIATIARGDSIDAKGPDINIINILKPSLFSFIISVRKTLAEKILEIPAFESIDLENV